MTVPEFRGHSTSAPALENLPVVHNVYMLKTYKNHSTTVQPIHTLKLYRAARLPSMLVTLLGCNCHRKQSGTTEHRLDV